MDAFIIRKRPRSIEKRESTSDTRPPSLSPPPKKNTQKKTVLSGPETIDLTEDDAEKKTHDLTETVRRETMVKSATSPAKRPSNKTIPSPMQLNHIQGLPASSSIDTVKLSDILGDPMIKECWLFNYLFDIDFVMQQFDSDTRDAVRIRVVHGSWKAEDSNGIGIIDGGRRYPNIQIIKAYMAEAFGTHHSKMIVLFRHDDLAQVVILTANLIERDWSMSQAIWRTPLLPLLQQRPSSTPSISPLGSGPRFKHDLLAYLRGYGPSKLQDLITTLQQHDFSTVRGALIASVPGRQILQSLDPENETLWGWPALKNIFSHIPSSAPTTPNPTPPQIIAQVSSVASVGEKWLKTTFFPALSTSASPKDPNNNKNTTTSTTPPTPKIALIFPTASTIRRSLTGYAAGASIHMKTSTPTQRSQLTYLHPLLHHWSPPSHKPPSASTFFSTSSPPRTRSAGRHRAAPHIKTYIRFRNSAMERIEWAMVTSANVSVQAWGTGGGEVRICSFEIGVVVWADLFGGEGAVMVPVFGGDMPGEGLGEREGVGEGKGEGERTVVGWRMPYDLPLIPYAKDERPWCASEADGEKDCLGRVWPGYER